MTPCQQPHPHHVFSRGAGRLDIRCNLISLCGPWQNNCHGRVHNGEISRSSLIAIIAVRDGCTADDVVEKVYSLRRA